MSIFFTSDTHFGANGIIEREHRPFKNANEYAEEQIGIWNGQTKEGDIIKHLGDWASYNDREQDGWYEAFKLVEKVNATVDLILGNNEYRLIEQVYHGDKKKFIRDLQNLGFRYILDNELIQLGNEKVYLVHRPSEHSKEYLTLFGHVHRSCGLYKPFGFNVGTDLNHFRLYAEDDIKWLEFEADKFWRKDLDTNIIT